MVDWIQVGGSIGVHCGPHARGPVLRGCPISLAHEAGGTSPRAWAPTVDSYGPTRIQSSIHGTLNPVELTHRPRHFQLENFAENFNDFLTTTGLLDPIAF